MPRHQHTSVRSRRLAAELRRLREERGMSCQDVADRLGMPASRINKLEAGIGGIRLADVEILLSLYDVPAERRAELLAVLRQSHRHTWWVRQDRQPRHWRSLLHLESAATGLLDFQLHVLPCLLRTADYSRNVFGNGFARRSTEEINQLIDLQLARQAAFARPGGPVLHAVVDEHALAKLARTEPVSLAQLRHLMAISEQPNVTFQVIPNSVGMHAGMHGAFTIMEYGDDTDVVHIEQLVSASYYQTESDINVYRGIITSLLSDALSPADTRDFLFGLASGR